MTHFCKTCNLEKPIENFYKSYKSRCRSCCISKQKEWSKKNVDKCKQYKKKFLSNTENLIRTKNHKHQYYLRNKKKFIENSLKWKKKNRKHLNNYIRKLKENNPNYKISENLRSRIRTVLKASKKCSSTETLLGCSFEKFVEYLKSKFQLGMAMENHGKWHIDHIKPCSSFDLTNEEEQKKCFHYTNLQPLWAKDNLKKYNKFI